MSALNGEKGGNSRCPAMMKSFGGYRTFRVVRGWLADSLRSRCDEVAMSFMGTANGLAR